MSEWVCGSLSELASGVRGVSYTPNQLQRFMTPETVILLRSNNIKGGQVNYENIQLIPTRIVSKAQLAQHGDIAVCMSNGSKALVGKSGRIVGNYAPCTVGAFCSIFRPHKYTDKKFVSYVFQSGAYRRHLDIILAGSAINNLKNSDVEALSLEIPPRQEQQFIAKVLDILDTQIHKTEALIAKLEKVKEGLLHDLLTRGIDENGQLRPSPKQAPELYKDSPLGLIPKEWEVSRVDEAGDVVTGSTPPSTLTNAWEGPHLFFTPADMGDYELLKVAERTLSESGAKHVRLIPAEATLVVCIGSTIGKVGITSCPGATNQQINSVIPLSKWNTYFVYQAIRHHVGQIHAWAGLQAVPIVNKSTFGQMLIPQPKTDEQSRIAESMKTLDERVYRERAAVQKLRKEKKGLMDDLLTGRVRVTPLLDQAQTPA